MPSITNLVTTTALISVENKGPNVSDLVKKDYHAEIKDIMNKYLATFEYYKFMNDILDAKITAKKFANDKNISKKTIQKNIGNKDRIQGWVR